MIKKHLKLVINAVLLVIGIAMVTFPIDGILDREASKTSISDGAGNPPPSAKPVPITIPVFVITPTSEPTLTPAPTPIPTPTPQPTLSPAQNPLFTNAPEDVEKLIEDYYITKLASIEEFKKLFYNPEYVDEELTNKRIEYIVAYHNIKAYFKKGTGIIDYVAYVVNDAEIATIETYAISIDQLFIRLDDKGNPKIYLPDEELSAEEEAYYVELASADDVAELVNSVNKALLRAVEEDSDLKDFLMRLTNASNESTEKD